MPANAPDAVGALLQQADSARREGAPARAAALLQQIVKEHSNDSRVALAHFTLGRLHLDALGDPQRAVVDFTRALERGVPGALAEDAQARLVQALARAGDHRGAESASARYRAHYPSGRHLQDVERWVRAAAGQ
jgi:transmembrane sensor